MFDTERFISEVEKHPALYNVKLKEYSNRDIKKKLWDEVAVIMYENWDSFPVDQKNKLVALNRQSNTRQRVHNRNVFTKRRIAQQQQQHKPVSLIDDKSDWNGTLFPFRGTGQLYNEEPVENSNDFDDAEWSEEAASNAPEKIVLKNALGALMSAYNSGDDSEIEDLIPKNEITVTKHSNKSSEQQLCETVTKNSNVDLNEDRTGFVETNNRIQTPSFTVNNDEAPTEEKIRPVEVPLVSDALSDNEAPIEQRIERREISPEQCAPKLPTDNKRTRKRKRVHRKASNYKEQKHGCNDNANKQHCKSRNIYKKRRITLLERLLENEIIHERNVLLQCVRYVIANGFFDEKVNQNKKEEDKTTEVCEIKDGNIPAHCTIETTV